MSRTPSLARSISCDPKLVLLRSREQVFKRRQNIRISGEISRSKSVVSRLRGRLELLHPILLHHPLFHGCNLANLVRIRFRSRRFPQLDRANERPVGVVGRLRRMDNAFKNDKAQSCRATRSYIDLNMPAYSVLHWATTRRSVKCVVS